MSPASPLLSRVDQFAGLNRPPMFGLDESSIQYVGGRGTGSVAASTISWEMIGKKPPAQAAGMTVKRIGRPAGASGLSRGPDGVK